MRCGWRRQCRCARTRAPWLHSRTRQDQHRAGPHPQQPQTEGKGASCLTAMTNTLHRYGDAESFRDDYIVFATASRGKNDEDCVPRLKKFLEMALPFHPVNLGDDSHGGGWRAARALNPGVHWNRDMGPNFQAVIDGIDQLGTVAAVFDNRPAAED